MVDYQFDPNDFRQGSVTVDQAIQILKDGGEFSIIGWTMICEPTGDPEDDFIAYEWSNSEPHLLSEESARGMIADWLAFPYSVREKK